MDEKTQAEYDRIKLGPQTGQFTFLHHNGPVTESSENVMQRVEYLLQTKEVSEHYARLRHIYPVPAPAHKAYWEATASAQKAYDEAIGPAQKLILALIPDCAWNGKTILGEKS